MINMNRLRDSQRDVIHILWPVIILAKILLAKILLSLKVLLILAH